MVRAGYAGTSWGATRETRLDTRHDQTRHDVPYRARLCEAYVSFFGYFGQIQNVQRNTKIGKISVRLMLLVLSFNSKFNWKRTKKQENGRKCKMVTRTEYRLVRVLVRQQLRAVQCSLLSVITSSYSTDLRYCISTNLNITVSVKSCITSGSGERQTETEGEG